MSITPRMAESQPRKSKHAREIGGEFFPTAKAIRDRCRHIFDQYVQTADMPNVKINEEHMRFFVELVRPSMAVVEAYKSTSDGQLGRHLRFLYEDGSDELVGWISACGSAPNRRADANAAMRFESSKLSRDILASFFSARPPWLCQKSGVHISQSGGFDGHLPHVHHDGQEWATIRDEWLALVGMSLEEVPTEPHFDGRGNQMPAGDLRDSWRQYHESRASLVVVSKSWHETHHANNRKESPEVDG